ncbi:MAG: hypothetical protein HFJ36_06040 [Clostridia bacterium]|nr:hypothetical protein [Clostridia bacterium]
MKKIQRINFLEIFEKINGVEEILRKDPSNIYENMTDNTKDEYRSKIKELAKKTKISEIYIAKKALELATNNLNNNTSKLDNKESHIGYYLIDKGINQLYDVLKYKTSRPMNPKDKVKAYLLGIVFLTILFAIRNK